MLMAYTRIILYEDGLVVDWLIYGLAYLRIGLFAVWVIYGLAYLRIGVFTDWRI